MKLFLIVSKSFKWLIDNLKEVSLVGWKLRNLTQDISMRNVKQLAQNIPIFDILKHS